MGFVRQFLPIVLLAVGVALYNTNPLNNDTPKPTKARFTKVVDYQLFAVAKARVSKSVWLGVASTWVRADWAEKPSERLEYADKWLRKKYQPFAKAVRKRLEKMESADIVIALNVIVFILWNVVSTRFMIRHFALQHDSMYRPWTLITCNFSHSDVLQMVIEMSVLTKLVPRCEDYVGTRFFFQLMVLIWLANALTLLLWHSVWQTDYWSYMGSLAQVIGMTAAFTRDQHHEFVFWNFGPMSGDQMLFVQICMVAMLFGKQNLPGVLAAALAGATIGPYFASRAQFIFYEDAVKWTSDLIGKSGWR